MGAYDDLLACDMLRLESVACTIDSPLSSVRGPSDTVPGCVAKPSGEARFTLPCDRLIAIPLAVISFDGDDGGTPEGFDFPIEFASDEPPTLLQNGDAVVHWKVDQAVERDVQLGGEHARIHKVVGGITTVVRSRRPYTADTDCSGGARWVAANVDFYPGENALTFKGTAHAYGSDHDFDVTAKNFMVKGWTAEPLSFGAVITEIHDACGIGAVPGGVARFHAMITGKAPDASVQYEWSVSGPGAEKALSPPNVTIFRVQLADPMGQPPSSCTVSLHATVDGVPADGVLTYVPSETPDTVAMKQFVCKLKGLVQSLTHPYANPLWDPLRDLVAEPLTRSDVERVARIGAAITEIADGMRQLQTRASGRG